MAHLGDILMELRQDAGMTQRELGNILHVSPGTISNYENGVHLPDVEKLLVFADYFNVTTDYLLCRTLISISSDLLQRPLANGKTISDIINIILRLSPERQQALVTLISDMEISLLISEYNKRGVN